MMIDYEYGAIVGYETMFVKQKEDGRRVTGQEDLYHAPKSLKCHDFTGLSDHVEAY